MLELRPVCEGCAVELPANSTLAMICSFECTFCADCVRRLRNVCPNCGGGFTARPIRPAHNWKGDNYLGAKPASQRHVHKPVDYEVHAVFAASIADIPPAQR